METLSLPARGAWIEIPNDKGGRKPSFSRSPRGERGLKFTYGGRGAGKTYVAPREGSVD